MKSNINKVARMLNQKYRLLTIVEGVPLPTLLVSVWIVTKLLNRQEWFPSHDCPWYSQNSCHHKSGIVIIHLPNNFLVILIDLFQINMVCSGIPPALNTISKKDATKNVSCEEDIISSKSPWFANFSYWFLSWCWCHPLKLSCRQQLFSILQETSGSPSNCLKKENRRMENNIQGCENVKSKVPPLQSGRC